MSRLVDVCTSNVCTGLVRNVTFSADQDLIERAREVAKAEHKTLNVAFRE